MNIQVKRISVRSNQPTRCMECGREIPAGMTYRKVVDKRGMRIGDHCYLKCKPLPMAKALKDEVDNVQSIN